jgi:hypothetical protein
VGLFSNELPKYSFTFNSYQLDSHTPKLNLESRSGEEKRDLFLKQADTPVQFSIIMTLCSVLIFHSHQQLTENLSR